MCFLFAGYRPDSDVEFTHGLFVNTHRTCKLVSDFLNLNRSEVFKSFFRRGFATPRKIFTFFISQNALLIPLLYISSQTIHKNQEPWWLLRWIGFVQSKRRTFSSFECHFERRCEILNLTFYDFH